MHATQAASVGHNLEWEGTSVHLPEIPGARRVVSHTDSAMDVAHQDPHHLRR